MLSEQDRKLVLSDPVAFISHYSGFRLKDFHCQTLYVADTHRRSIFLYFATGGKSSLLSKWYPIYKIAQNRNVRIILGLKNDAEKSTYARAIRGELAHNKRLIADFGVFEPKGRGRVWSNDEIEIAGRQITEPQPTILFVSSSAIDQVLGRRCDLFIMDDIVTPTTVNTQELRNKQWELFSEGVETSPQYIWDRDPSTGRLLVPDGIDWPQDVQYEQGIICGTVFHPDDLFHRKIQGRGGIKVADMENGVVYEKVNDPMYCALKFDIWRDEAKQEPMWPERWTPKKIHETEKSKGTISFNRRYRNIAIDEGSVVFKKHWIFGGLEGNVDWPGCLDRNRSWGEFLRDDGSEMTHPYIFCGLDPSTGRKGKGTTFSSFIVMAVDRDEDPMRRYLIDIRRGQIGFDDILSNLLFGDSLHGITGLFSLYRYNEGRVEVNAAQTWLLENSRVKEAEISGVRLLPHETQSRNKSDPLIGVTSMQGLFKNGYVSIPYATPEDQEKAQELIDQLLIFPEGVHDYAMALWFCECGVRALGSKYKAYGAERGERITNAAYRR